MREPKQRVNPDAQLCPKAQDLAPIPVDRRKSLRFGDFMVSKGSPVLSQSNPEPYASLTPPRLASCSDLGSYDTLLLTLEFVSQLR